MDEKQSSSSRKRSFNSDEQQQQYAYPNVDASPQKKSGASYPSIIALIEEHNDLVEKEKAAKISWTSAMITSLIELYAAHLKNSLDNSNQMLHHLNSNPSSIHSGSAGTTTIGGDEEDSSMYYSQDMGIPHRSWKMISEHLSKKFTFPFSPKACKSKFVKIKLDYSICKWLEIQLEPFKILPNDENKERKATLLQKKKEELVQNDPKLKKYLEKDYKFPYVEFMDQLFPPNFVQYAKLQENYINSSSVSGNFQKSTLHAADRFSETTLKPADAGENPAPIQIGNAGNDDGPESDASVASNHSQESPVKEKVKKVQLPPMGPPKSIPTLHQLPPMPMPGMYMPDQNEILHHHARISREIQSSIDNYLHSIQDQIQSLNNLVDEEIQLMQPYPGAPGNNPAGVGPFGVKHPFYPPGAPISRFAAPAGYPFPMAMAGAMPPDYYMHRVPFAAPAPPSASKRENTKGHPGFYHHDGDLSTISSKVSRLSSEPSIQSTGSNEKKATQSTAPQAQEQSPPARPYPAMGYPLKTPHGSVPVSQPFPHPFFPPHPTSSSHPMPGTPPYFWPHANLQSPPAPAMTIPSHPSLLCSNCNCMSIQSIRLNAVNELKDEKYNDLISNYHNYSLIHHIFLEKDYKFALQFLLFAPEFKYPLLQELLQRFSDPLLVTPATSSSTPLPNDVPREIEVNLPQVPSSIPHSSRSHVSHHSHHSHRSHVSHHSHHSHRHHHARHHSGKGEKAEIETESSIRHHEEEEDIEESMEVEESTDIKQEE